MFVMNGWLWEIWYVPRRSKYLMRSDGTYTLGMCDCTNRIIYIQEDLPYEKMQEVLCHELCHAAIMEYGFDFDVETEEIVAQFLALHGREVFRVADDILGRLAT